MSVMIDCPQQINDTAQHQRCDGCGRCITCDGLVIYMVGSRYFCRWCGDARLWR